MPRSAARADPTRSSIACCATPCTPRRRSARRTRARRSRPAAPTTHSWARTPLPWAGRFWPRCSSLRGRPPPSRRDRSRRRHRLRHQRLHPRPPPAPPPPPPRAERPVAPPPMPSTLVALPPPTRGRRLRVPRLARGWRRRVALVLGVVGLLLLAEVLVTLVWKEPFTAYLTSQTQDDLSHQLDHRRVSLQASEQRTLAGISDTNARAHERVALLAQHLDAAVPAGEALGRIEIPKLGVNYV